MSGRFLNVVVYGGLMELWFDDNLIEEEQWGRTVERLQSETGDFIEDETVCRALITKELVSAVKQRMPQSKFGIFLSGGLDSSLLTLIAQQLKGQFICYTAGFGEAKDAAFARKAAESLGVEWKLKLLTIDEVETYIQKAVAIMKPVQLVDPVSVGVSAVLMAAVDLARADGVTTFFGGLGAEEIFGGYHRHVEAEDVHEECWRGLKAMWGKDFVRDAALAKALGITVLTPFLDEKLITAAMRVPGKYKIVDGAQKSVIFGTSKSADFAGERKVILRKAAEELGLVKEIAWRKKSAAQYGSSFDKALEKLAKKQGCKDKGLYLKSIRKAF